MCVFLWLAGGSVMRSSGDRMGIRNRTAHFLGNSFPHDNLAQTDPRVVRVRPLLSGTNPPPPNPG